MKNSQSMTNTIYIACGILAYLINVVLVENNFLTLISKTSLFALSFITSNYTNIHISFRTKRHIKGVHKIEKHDDLENLVVRINITKEHRGRIVEVLNNPEEEKPT